MYFNETETTIMFAIKDFPIGRLPEAINMGNRCGCTIWVDSRSINEYNRGDVFVACGSEESLAEIACFLQNTMDIFSKSEVA